VEQKDKDLQQNNDETYPSDNAERKRPTNSIIDAKLYV
jgi:hypothetical protein